MKNAMKIIGEVVVAFGFLYGLHRGGVISLEAAIIIGTIAVIILLSFEDLKGDLKSQFYPIRNALAEIQRHLKLRNHE